MNGKAPVKGYASLFKSAEALSTAKPLTKKKKEIPTPSPTPLLKSNHLERWRVVNTSQKGPLIVPRGLSNNGNMCFMNCILQPLVHSPPFYMFLMGLRQRTMSSGGELKPTLLANMMEFVSEFRSGNEYVNVDQGIDYGNLTIDESFSGDYVYDAIRVSAKIDALKGRQEDANEFLGFLLDTMHEELLKTIDKPKIETESGEWTQVRYSPILISKVGKKNVVTMNNVVHPTQITRIFGGVWKSTVRSGGKDSISTEPFTSVLLDISVSDLIVILA